MPELRTDADLKARKRLDALLYELPPYCRTFINAKAASKSIRTLLGYAEDLKTFFYYIVKNNPSYQGMSPSAVSFDVLKELSVHDIEEYVAFMKTYEMDDIFDKNGGHLVRHNGDDGIRRKIASLSAFFGYFYKLDELSGNPVSKFELPKRKEKDIVILDDDEIDTLLTKLKDQSIWTDAEMRFHKKTKYRDVALYTLLLCTGLRVSEAVALNMNDIDFEHRQFRIRRKGGKYQVIGMNEELTDALSEYIEYDRPFLSRSPETEPALFLSLRKSRLSQRQIESMTAIINERLFPMKHVSPHTFRKCFGSSVQQTYGDIYLTASCLGHSDINTTRRHYAKQDQDKVTDVFRKHSY